MVAQRGEQHVVDCLGLNAHGGWHVIVAGPPAPGEVRVLDAPAYAALRSLVNLMPEPECAFDDHARVSGARPASARCKLIRRRILRAATGVVGERAAVAA